MWITRPRNTRRTMQSRLITIIWKKTSASVCRKHTWCIVQLARGKSNKWPKVAGLLNSTCTPGKLGWKPCGHSTAAFKLQRKCVSGIIRLRATCNLSWYSDIESNCTHAANAHKHTAQEHRDTHFLCCAGWGRPTVVAFLSTWQALRAHAEVKSWQTSGLKQAMFGASGLVFFIPDMSCHAYSVSQTCLIQQ